MKILDALLNILVKHGLMGEMTDFTTEIEIPSSSPDRPGTKVKIFAKSLQITVISEDDKR
mgnify:CR=1 FL=1